MLTAADTGTRTTVDRTWLHDARLSLKAKGLLAVAADLADTGQDVTLPELLKHSPDSKTAVQPILWDLIGRGYLTRHERRNRQPAGRGARFTYVYRFPVQSAGGDR